MSMPLHGRLGIKVELGAGPSSAGRADGRHPRPGLGVLPGQGAMLGHTCFPGHPGGRRPLPARPLLCPLSSLFPPLRLCRLPALVPVVFISFPPAAVSLSLPTSAPRSLPLCLCPSALVASPLGAPSSLSVLAWSPCPRVPGSLCVGGDGGVPREESVGFFTPAAGWLSW